MEELIQLFWSGKASDAEKKALLEKVSYPEPGWEQRLKEGWLKSLETNEAVEVGDEWFKDQLDLLQQNIVRRSTIAEKLHRTRRLRVWSLSAAAVLILVVAGIYMLNDKDAFDKTTVAGTTTQDVPAYTEAYNNTAVAKRITLPDGSVIIMEPGALLRYQSSYGTDHRQLILAKGIARFKVAGNSSKPFNVIAGATRTTALGTLFRIDASDTALIKIKLLEGKVKVDGAVTHRFPTEVTYLLPGQELSVDLLHRTARLTEQPGAHKTELADTAGPIPADTISALRFEQQSLDKVFRRLEQHFHVAIQCNRKEMSQRWFTGNFEPTDSLDMILTSICNMNALRFRQDGEAITIYKK